MGQVVRWSSDQVGEWTEIRGIILSVHTKDTPQGIVGLRFAEGLLAGDYETAHQLLSVDLKLQYPIAALKENFERMMSHAHAPSDVPEIEVMDNGDLGDSALDAEGWAYIPIWSEAVTITARPFGPDHLITDLIWGRP
jgi:hypothetical protein